MWILTLTRPIEGGNGLPQDPASGGGGGSGVGCGAGGGVAAGVAVGCGAGAGVAVGRGVDGIGSVRMPEPGDSVGCVGSSSVIVWQPARATAIAAAHQAFRVIGTPYA